MPFQLNIRQNVRAADDHFRSGQIREFSGEWVRVGRDETCECRLDEPGFADWHFSIHVVPTTLQALIVPRNGVELFVNQSPIDAETELRSGDEIRVGHWSLLFQKVYPIARHARRADLLATLAKVLVAAILVFEVGIVVWLPRHMRAATLWQQEVTRQRTIMLLDQLRAANASTRPEEEVKQAAHHAIGAELDRLARYVREYREEMGREAWQRMHEDLQGYERILLHLQQDTAFEPVPEVNLRQGVRSILGDRDGGKQQE